MARNSKNRKEKYSIAIVGEGETEWHYFDNLRTEKRFSFQISPEIPKHSDYESIFKHAEKLADNGYDEVYCVLDLDVFEGELLLKYEAKKNKILKKRPQIKVIETFPCFEFWFLLHYKDYSSKFYDNKSLLNELRKFIPNYEKHVEFFRKVKLYSLLTNTGNEEKAISNADKLLTERIKNYNPKSPFSMVQQILKSLESTQNKND